MDINPLPKHTKKFIYPDKELLQDTQDLLENITSKKCIAEIILQFRTWNQEWDTSKNNNPKSVEDFLDELNEKYIIRKRKSND